MKYKEKLFLISFILILGLFCFSATRVTFHDDSEYISLSKAMVGINNINVYTTHSPLYPFVISLFLRIVKNLFIIRLINCIWLVLIAVFLLLGFEDKKGFLLFLFSPLVYYLSIQISPILPASFFLLLAYFFLKKEEIKYSKFYSAISLGLACAFYDVMILVSFLFIVIYFFKEKLSNVFLYLGGLVIGMFPRFLLDYIYFNFPGYSFFKFIGVNIIISLGMSSTVKSIAFPWIELFLSFFVISPFLFMLYKSDFKENKQDFIFLILTFLILFVRGFKIKYLIIISPILLVYLGKALNKKQIKLHCLISLIIVGIITFGFFGINQDYLVKKDINKITQEFPNQNFIAGPYEASYLSIFLWESYPKIYWLEEYNSQEGKNKTPLKSYNFFFDQSKINLRDYVKISINFYPNNQEMYADRLISKNKTLTQFDLEKCYEKLCVYLVNQTSPFSFSSKLALSNKSSDS